MGQSREVSFEIERIVFFSDAVFAIAITLMVVDLRIPEDITESGLSDALRQLSPHYISFLLSFLVIGVFWVAHHRMFRFIRRWDQGLLAINLLLLLTIAFLPFPTSLIGRFNDTKPATMVYSTTVLCCALASTGLWWHASHGRRLVDRDLDAGEIRYFQFRGLLVAVIFGLAVVTSLFSATGAQVVWWLAFPVHLVVTRMVKPRLVNDRATIEADESNAS
jgi:TMEM175 potassium channel family protein